MNASVITVKYIFIQQIQIIEQNIALLNRVCHAGQKNMAWTKQLLIWYPWYGASHRIMDTRFEKKFEMKVNSIFEPLDKCFSVCFMNTEHRKWYRIYSFLTQDTVASTSQQRGEVGSSRQPGPDGCAGKTSAPAPASCARACRAWSARFARLLPGESLGPEYANRCCGLRWGCGGPNCARKK